MLKLFDVYVKFLTKVTLLETVSHLCFTYVILVLYMCYISVIQG